MPRPMLPRPIQARRGGEGEGVEGLTESIVGWVEGGWMMGEFREKDLEM